MPNRLDYIHHNNRRTAIVILVAVLVALVLAFLAGSRSGSQKETLGDRLNTLTDKRKGPKAQAYYATEDGRKAELFPFDPNSADSTALLRLGLSPYIVRNIYNYRAKGGTFRRPQDFARIYGLTAGQYRQLEPYIRISSDYLPASEVVGGGRDGSGVRGKYGDYDSRPYFDGDGGTYESGSQEHASAGNGTQQSSDNTARPQKLKAGEMVGINTADTVLLCRIPGIGPYFARQIHRYRERLGGFVSKQQLLEIEGFPESSLPFFTDEIGKITKLNVNKATAEQLRNHPYIDFRQARDIITYRRQYGTIKDINDLRATRAFGDKGLKAIAPYIAY